MTRGELGALLLSDTTRLEEPVLLALGRGRILAPLRVADCYAQELPTAGYRVLHTDPLSGRATALVEAPRTEPTL